MSTNSESPPPAFSKPDEVLPNLGIDDTLLSFGSDSANRKSLEKMGSESKIKVKKKGQSLAGIKSVFSSKKRPVEPNCTKEKNLKKDSCASSLCINCEGCQFSSDLLDPECRLMCAKLAGKENCRTLILDNGFYKKEYGSKDVESLKELYNIAETVSIRFPDKCGLCAKEHEAQVEKLRMAMMKDPVRLLKGGIEVEENPDMTVKGVEPKVCEDCRLKTEDCVNRALQKLAEAHVVKGYKTSPMVRPFFSNTRVLFEIPDRACVESVYDNGDAKVIISRSEEEVYSIFPPEYKLNRRQLEAMKLAYSNIIKNAGSLDDKQFASACKKEILSAASKLGFEFSEEDSIQMTEDLVRCTAGLDVIELLLKDPNLQDVYINSPIDTTPLYVKHNDFDDCRTNIYLSEEAAKNIVSKFRLQSGRAFSEVSPILDMELPEFGVRVNITGPPISPDGLAFAFRRASEEPWTLLRFIENKMISPLAAGLLGMIVNEETTVLMCGDRGSGKTSMLTALVGAMPVKNRILTMEDTFEIPVPALANDGGFRIQRMRIKPSTAGESFEKSADEAMRSLLRMGDSAIVMGEVRGTEARTLYEAMNVGGSGNCVLGTIHGKSPRSLLERVVFSLGVPPQSFKATDLVVIADRIRPGGGSTKLRRVTEIVEVGKNWKEPEAEKVFSSLMNYNQDSDMLELSERLENPAKSEVLCKIAGKRGVGPETVMQDVRARAEVYKYAVDLFKKIGDRKLLSMKTMVGLNREYLKLVDRSLAETGTIDYKLVAGSVKEWLDDIALNKVRIEPARVELLVEDKLKTKEDGLREAL